MFRKQLLFFVLILMAFLNTCLCGEFWKGHEDICFHNVGFYPSPKCRIKCLKEKYYIPACDNLGRCFCIKKTIKPISLDTLED
uniref:CSON011250 protein n=1 Tax=Culicoides sonorensis TaxID=179676 RepID=A0A336M377_CULSO